MRSPQSWDVDEGGRTSYYSSSWGVWKQVEGVWGGAADLLEGHPTVALLISHCVCEQNSTNFNLSADAVGVVHASQHLAKIIGIYLASCPREVLDTVCGGSGGHQWGFNLTFSIHSLVGRSAGDLAKQDVPSLRRSGGAVGESQADCVRWGCTKLSVHCVVMWVLVDEKKMGTHCDSRCWSHK